MMRRSASSQVLVLNNSVEIENGVEENYFSNNSGYSFEVLPKPIDNVK